MRCIVLLALFAAVVLAQNGTDVPNSLTVNPETHPYGSSICAMDRRFDNHDKSSFYSASFSGPTRICVKQYLDVCATITGVVTCNKATHVCVDTEYSWNDAKQYPNVAAVMLKRPEVCIEAGAYRTPDTAVVMIAQIVFSGVFLIAGYVMFAVQVNCNAAFKGLAAVYLVLCLILLFSYYYLNAIIMFAAVTAAAACFSLKCDKCLALGFAILISAFFWVTFYSGLGYIQHHSRFEAGNIETNFYEEKCNQYYNGLFAWPNDLHQDDQNIALQYRGFCNRDWLAAELFFMILAEQLLVLMIALGAFFHFKEEAPQEDEAPKAQE